MFSTSGTPPFFDIRPLSTPGPPDLFSGENSNAFHAVGKSSSDSFCAPLYTSFLGHDTFQAGAKVTFLCSDFEVSINNSDGEEDTRTTPKRT